MWFVQDVAQGAILDHFSKRQYVNAKHAYGSFANCNGRGDHLCEGSLSVEVLVVVLMVVQDSGSKHRRRMSACLFC